MFRGRLVGEVDPKTTSEAEVVALATGAGG